MSDAKSMQEPEDTETFPYTEQVDWTVDPNWLDMSFADTHLPDLHTVNGMSDQQLAGYTTLADTALSQVPDYNSSTDDLHGLRLQDPHDHSPDVSRGLDPEPSSDLGTTNMHSSTRAGPTAQNTGGYAPNAVPHGPTGLPRRRSRYLVRQPGEYRSPIFIPNGILLDPMERWQESPPEDEPASMSAIIDAMRHSPAHRSSQSGSSHLKSRNSNRNAFRGYRQAPSVTSGESSGSSKASADSGVSHLSSRETLAGKGRDSPSRAGQAHRKNRKSSDRPRKFCCTFCCDTFKSKYDWARHEKSLHLNLEAWHCAPHGTTVISPTTGKEYCAFCNALNPTPEHLDEHDQKVCYDENGSSRSFRRKDHLVQHLRLVHQVDTVPRIDDWRIGPSDVPSRCGFCNHAMTSWAERVDHLAGHFRKGSTMNDWYGEHEFPPPIAAQVTNSLPPYLIGSASQSLIPFSATSSQVRDHFAQISTRARWADDEQKGDPVQAAPSETVAPSLPLSQLSTFTEILTLHLSRYARKQINEGVVPTDEMFQQESRRVLYDSDDSWNQTIADNPEWLSAFRNTHCDQSGDRERKADAVQEDMRERPP